MTASSKGKPDLVERAERCRDTLCRLGCAERALFRQLRALLRGSSQTPRSSDPLLIRGKPRRVRAARDPKSAEIESKFLILIRERQQFQALKQRAYRSASPCARDRSEQAHHEEERPVGRIFFGFVPVTSWWSSSEPEKRETGPTESAA